ncbi:tyrosine-type recombinase/integrase [Bacillaceae bacterium S4-13-58]
MPKKRKPKRTPVYLTRKEVSVLLKLPDGSTKASARDRVLLSVLYASGARAQELCDITVGDIRFDDKTSVKLVGKGNKGRIVTIPDKCAELLLFHLKSNGITNKFDKYVFSSQTHEHMSISCVEGIVKKYVRLAKRYNSDLFPEKSYTPHSFRHSIAVHMLESGIPLPVIKNFLGHTSIETTMMYATVSDDLINRYLKDKNILGDMIPSKQSIPATEKSGLEFLKTMKV